MKKLGFLYIFLAGVLWGTSGIFVHFLAPFGFNSLQMTAMRGIISAICMSAYILFRDKKLFKIKKTELILYFFTGVSIIGTSAFYFISIQASSVSTAVVLMYTAPVIVMIYSVIFFKEKLTKLKLISVVSMLLGCILVSGIISGLKFSFWGIISGLLAGVSYSAYNILTKIEMQKKLNPITANLYCFAFMGILTFLFSQPSQTVSIISKSPLATIPLVIGIGIFTCIFPYFFYTLGLKELPAGSASAMGIVEPMAATVFSILFLNETLSIYSACGIILILGSVFMLSRSEK